MNGNDSDMMDLKCSCGHSYRVHKPGIMRLANVAVAQMLLFPVAGIEERICPGCKQMNSPMIGEAQIRWARQQTATQEQPRIIVPNVLTPGDLSRKQ